MKKLLTIGISEDMKEYQRDLIAVSNLSAVILLIASAVLLAFFLFASPDDLAFILIPIFLGAATLYLNFLGLNRFARFVFLVGGALFFTFLHAYIWVDAHLVIYHLLALQMSFFVLTWLMTDPREPGLVISIFFLQTIMFFGFPWLNDWLNAVNDFSVVASEVFTWSVTIFSILIILISAFHIQRRSFGAEKSFDAISHVLNEKTKELDQQEEELQKTLRDISNAHKEDDKRSWISSGIAEINNILRTQDDMLYDRLIRGIVKYAGLMYGGIYEMEENDHDDKHFALKASYGFDKEKLEKRRYSVNEGILSRVYYERASVYSVEITEEYGMIQSGLGESIPGSVYILPLIHEEKIKGVLEVAAFQKIEGKERDFMDRVANVLARFIESYQVSIQSRHLLETTQQQNEEMRSQEEEMRQNMEELQATQEELHRKEQEYISRIKDLEKQLQSKESLA